MRTPDKGPKIGPKSTLRRALPDGVGTDGVVKFFPFSLFFGDVLWNVCAQKRYVGPFVSEKKSSLTMKEGLNEVVKPDLSENCLQRSDSKYFQFLALDFCPDSERLTNARVQEDGCFSSPTPCRCRQSAVQSNRPFSSFFLRIFP